MAIEVGGVAEGKVTGITKFGAFIDLGEGKVGLVHISQIANTYVKDVSEHLKVGDPVKVKVVGVTKDGKYDLSIKQLLPDSKPSREKKLHSFTTRRLTGKALQMKPRRP